MVYKRSEKTDLREQFEQIKKNEDVRQSLISIRAELRGGQGLKELKALFQEEPEALLSKLGHEDAKVRKNAALVLGSIGTPALCEKCLPGGP